MVIFTIEFSGSTLKKCLLETKVIDWSEPFLFYFIGKPFKPILEFVINEKQKQLNLNFNVKFHEVTFYFKPIEECAKLQIEP